MTKNDKFNTVKKSPKKDKNGLKYISAATESAITYENTAADCVSLRHHQAIASLKM
ncbi:MULTISPECIES: hypothetical protein [Symbiopectobacterium]|uniref:hypothetical protein n=1 Tax=Symbiopectobacterium TaxID=801 RepID=UPI002079D6F5|nr:MULTISPECIES: hypothetical protein [Symbiopectobacterium]MBT9429176.1 hypothetical protein [Candidatus Symbiopectobacterium endolongispinus]